jgi:hypothetical protein
MGLYFHKPTPISKPQVQEENRFTQLPPFVKPPEEYPRTPQIGVPPYLSYKEIVERLKEWERVAPDLVEVGTYGKSTRGIDLYYIKVTNEKKIDGKMKVLLTACIHGNEPWSTGLMMGVVSNLLSGFNEKSILNIREVYLVPVISPDSYPHSREVDGVDPNRNFNGNSIAPVAAIKEFFLKHKFRAVLSGHTYGRIYLYPWDDKRDASPNDDDFKRIVGMMGKMSEYRIMKGVEIYNRPIYGAESDWYYRRNAFAVVMEVGTHQQKPTMEQITSELARTYGSVHYFIEEAPKVDINDPKYNYRYRGLLP